MLNSNIVGPWLYNLYVLALVVQLIDHIGISETMLNNAERNKLLLCEDAQMVLKL